MTITIKPVYLAIVGAFLGGVLLATGIVLVAGGNGGSPDEPSDPDTAVAQTATPTPDQEGPPATEPPSDPPDDSEPSAPPATATLEPVIRSCDAIRADGEYLNQAERDFFLSSRITPTAGSSSGSGASAPTSPPVAQPSVAITEADRRYRSQASSQLWIYITRFANYTLNPSLGVVNEILELGGIAGAWANQLFQFEPAPPRFKQAHNQIKMRSMPTMIGCSCSGLWRPRPSWMYGWRAGTQLAST